MGHLPILTYLLSLHHGQWRKVGRVKLEKEMRGENWATEREGEREYRKRNYKKKEKKYLNI